MTDDARGFRIVDRRYPKPPDPPAPPRPRPDPCGARDPEPAQPGNELCRADAGHPGLHSWQYCREYDPGSAYECIHRCERERGHKPPHREFFEW